MATATAVAGVSVTARCPLCGTEILSVGRGGHVEAAELHLVPLFRHGSVAEGYLLCEDCGQLAGMSDVTLN